jgi:hypothetical protein
VLNPGGVGDDGKFNGREEVGSKASMFIFVPRESCFMIANEIVHELLFFEP